ncbi:DUF2971 domain-containing protein [Thioalkalivibrio thiocyanodenitrificans]|uniref:DUF2971 domain-containing protein n=1 Tax=Thioalkalivibrio thiocyanodenitrificans TaxID=243063 RepID=UPI0018DEBDFB
MLLKYGRTSKSFNIKFRPPFPNINLDQTLGFVPVIYGHESQEELTKNVFPETYKRYKAGKMDKENALISCVYNFKKFAPIFKNPAFQEESEWRIIHTPLVLGDADGNLELQSACSEIGYRVTNNKIITHFELPLASSQQYPIGEIVLGPKNICEESLIELLLNDNGFKNIAILRSRASYR